MTEPVKKPRAVPTVHVNGTSRAALIVQLETVLAAVNHALRMAEQAAPNARDYYTQGDSKAWAWANAEHRSRLERLEAVRVEYAEIWDAVFES